MLYIHVYIALINNKIHLTKDKFVNFTLLLN